MKLNDQEIHSTLINSVRYCLTRHSYAAGDCVDFIRSRWAEIPENTRRIIVRDVAEATNENDELEYRWPDDIRQGWQELKELGYEYLPTRRSLSEASEDFGSPICAKWDYHEEKQ
jgi:hypothetical protein